MFLWYTGLPESILLGSPEPPPPPPPILPVPLVRARRAPLAVERVELWSKVQANGGTRIGPVAQVLGLTETVRPGEHSIALTIAGTHPLIHRSSGALPNFRGDQVLRLVMTDDTWSEHRIAEPDRRVSRGKRTLTVLARSILQDLGFRGIITRTTADGATTTTFESLGLPVRRQIEEHALTALREAGQPFWRVGTIEHEAPVDMEFDGDTALSSVRKLQAKAGGLEARVDGYADRYEINLVERVGIEHRALTIRARRDLLELGFRERSDDQATRVYAVGAMTDGLRPNMGSAVWEVSAVFAVPGVGYDIVLQDPAGGPGPIAFDGQFLPPEIEVDDPDTEGIETVPRYHLQFLTGATWSAPIIATSVATQRFRVESPTPPPETPLDQPWRHRVRIVADAGGRATTFVDHPEMLREYGVRAMVLERSDIPATENLAPHPICRVWSDGAALPEGWEWAGLNSTLTRETSPRYWAHGGQAIRMVWFPAGGLGSSPLVAPVAVVATRAQGYLSFFVRVTTLVGRVRVQAYFNRAEIDPDTGAATPLFPDATRQYVVPDSTGAFGVGDITLPDITSIELNTSEDLGVAAAWDLGKYPLYGGTVTLQVLPARDAPANTECIVEAVQVTNSHEQLPLIEGNGGARLHQAANQQVGLYGSPAPVIAVNLLDLAAQHWAFPFGPMLRQGRRIVLQDPGSGFAGIETRLVGWTRDWHNRLVPEVELSNERRDIVTLLASRGRAGRHHPTLVPAGTRGLTYAP